MKIIAPLSLIGCLLLVSCHNTQSFICGTAVFQQAMDDAEAQTSARYVYTDRESDADLRLRVFATDAATGASTETMVYFRNRWPDEAVVRPKRLDFPKRGMFWTSWPKESLATIYSDRIEIWLRFSKHASGGFLVRYGEDTKVEQDGFVIEGVWQQPPNKAPEPTPTSGTSAAEQPRVPAAGVAHL